MSCSVTTRPARQRPRLSLDRQDPVHQHERLVGQPDPRGVGVDRGELRAEHRADRADGEFQALVPVQRHGPARRDRQQGSSARARPAPSTTGDGIAASRARPVPAAPIRPSCICTPLRHEVFNPGDAEERLVGALRGRSVARSWRVRRSRRRRQGRRLRSGDRRSERCRDSRVRESRRELPSLVQADRCRRQAVTWRPPAGSGGNRQAFRPVRS